MAKLIVVVGPDSGDEHELPEAGERVLLTVGRDARVELPLNDTAVSRKHFTLERSNGRWRLADLGSRNQTFVNGAGVREAALRDGDVIRVGDTELRFENPGQPLEPSSGASTILKEIPAGKGQPDTLFARLASLEQAVARSGASTPTAEEPGAVVARVLKLFDAYGELAATSSSADLLEKLLSEAVPALRASRAAVVLREKGRWIVRASRGSWVEGSPVSVSQTILEKVAGEQKAVLSLNTREDDRFRGEGEQGREVRSVLAVPIACGGKTAGVIYADREGSATPFSEQDLQLLAALAEPAGSLLEKIEAEESLRQENRNLFRSITDAKKIIGRSRATDEALEFIRRAAPAPMTVLIQGETGTGKELVASAIHYASPRRGHPFVAINCAALPESLIESELFGHERGAFTGAVTRRKGRFELADRGTVFLDEVGELTLACQAKLLRLLEERQFERVGGTESVRVDVRIIAATNKDLLAAVGDGTFREDLYYRLGVLNVRLSPLRDRVEDISLLAQHFLEACGGNKRLGKPAEKKLAAYAWPGNIRQLKNVLESAVVLGDGQEIRPEDLVLPGAQPREPSKGKAAISITAKDPETWEPITLELLERIHIERVLAHTGGNKKRAAEMLGIERCTLYAKLKSYGLGSVKETVEDD